MLVNTLHQPAFAPKNLMLPVYRQTKPCRTPRLPGRSIHSASTVALRIFPRCIRSSKGPQRKRWSQSPAIGSTQAKRGGDETGDSGISCPLRTSPAAAPTSTAPAQLKKLRGTDSAHSPPVGRSREAETAPECRSPGATEPRLLKRFRGFMRCPPLAEKPLLDHPHALPHEPFRPGTGARRPRHAVGGCAQSAAWNRGPNYPGRPKITCEYSAACTARERARAAQDRGVSASDPEPKLRETYLLR
ncbi:hypothetical protein NDU88_007347 [Pleurodeles waltl]|uniref:Uncharacterized protein n=1 Tax=Pleurodeles waltl TaxID=8319 RepID=A0AAV7RPW0_PLEWA|nr:hypothetical protein NDU88_007347 [Pleurodeles waltl]